MRGYYNPYWEVEPKPDFKNMCRLSNIGSRCSDGLWVNKPRVIHVSGCNFERTKMDGHRSENIVRDPELAPVYRYCPDYFELLVEQSCRVLKASDVERGEELTGLKVEADKLGRKDILGMRAHIDQISPTGWVLEKEGLVTGVELLHKALPPRHRLRIRFKGLCKCLRSIFYRW